MPGLSGVASSAALQPTFRALADPTRREILASLADGDRTIGDVADDFAMTRAAVRKHLTVLEEGGLISVRAAGRERYTRLEAAKLKDVSDWVGAFSVFWDEKLAALKDAVEEEGRDDG